MKQIVKHLLCAFLVFTVLPLGAKAFVDVESGVAFTGYNNVRIPADTGTTFSLAQETPSNPLPMFRLRVGYTFADRHTKGSNVSIQKISVSGVKRYFTVVKPENYKKSNPTIVLLHGGSLSMQRILEKSNSQSRWKDLAEKEGFLLLVPNGYNRRKKDGKSNRQTWNDIRPRVPWNNISRQDDVSFIISMLDQVGKKHSINRSKIYVTGSSNGGMMALRLLIEKPEYFAAGAIFIGSLPRRDISLPKQGTPVMILNGDKDPLVKWNGGRVGKRGSPVRPVKEAVKYWLKANNIDYDKMKETLLPDRDTDDKCRIRRTFFPPKRNGKPVVFYEVKGGGHSIPDPSPPKRRPYVQRMLGPQCRDAHGVDLAWKFMKKYAADPKLNKKHKPGSVKKMPNSDAARDASGTGQLFESIHVPGLTDFHEGTNGFLLADLDGNGYLDIITVTTIPFALDENWNDRDDEVKRTRNPKDRLRILMNYGGFKLKEHKIVIKGSKATPEDLGQGWRGSQIPAMADFNGDGFLDLFITRQCPMSKGKVRKGFTPVGCSLFISDGAFYIFRDVSKEYNVLNKYAYNRQISLGDVNQDGFIDIALGADNVINAFEGLPHSALLLFKPKNGSFQGGRFSDIGGTKLIPDFGGFYKDSAKDKSGPNLALRDIDNDGDLDLLQSTHVLMNSRYPRGMPYSPAKYRQGVFTWRNLIAEKKKFKFSKSENNGLAVEARLKYSTQKGIYVPASSKRAPGLAYITFGDVNNDGYFDVIAVDGSDSTFTAKVEDVGGRFWFNLGNFKFREATSEAGLDSLNYSYENWYKFFKMRIPGFLKRKVNRRAYKVGQPGLPAIRPIDIRPYHADAIFADFNNDTWLDLVVLDRRVAKVIQTRAILYMNQGNGKFKPMPTTFSGLDSTGISGEAADLNNDGLVDLIFAGDPDNTGVVSKMHNYEDKVYLNTGLNGGRNNHYLRLRFSGISHARLIGTRVEILDVKTAKRIGTRGIYSNHTYKSSSPLEAHFGLGKATEVNLTAHLNGGKTIKVKGLKCDSFLDLNLANGKTSKVLDK